jgi:uncharacterized LabA/DUF88 family protein
MAAVYFDIDQFGYTKGIHKLLTREFGKMNIITKKYIGSKKSDMANLPEDIEGPHEKILCEKKTKDEKDKVDFRITIEIMKDLRNPAIKFFVIASRDTDFINIAEEVHRHGKSFGILLIHNLKEKLSPKLKEFCDMILTIQDGTITRGEHSIKKPKALEFHEMGTQTESEPEAKYSFIETYQYNMILGWINYNCRGYKNIAVELDTMMKQVKQNSKEQLISYHALQWNESNQLLSPSKFNCQCATFPSPLNKGPERCPIFHLYKGGVLKQEVVGANLKALRKAIALVYKVLI